MKGATFMISFGKYGGFYIHRKYTFRICIGWVAFTFMPIDIDTILTNKEDEK